jgi:hypothetical protein
VNGLQKLLSEPIQLLADLEKATLSLESVKDGLSTNNRKDTMDALIDATDRLNRFYATGVKPLQDPFAEACNGVEKIEKAGVEEAEEALNKAIETAESGSLSGQWHTINLLRQILGGVPSLDPKELNQQLKDAQDLLYRVHKHHPSQIKHFLYEANRILDPIKKSDRAIVRGLLSALKPDQQPERLDHAIQRERTYAALKVIWERRNDQEKCKELIGLQKQGGILEELFDKVDTWAWEGLKEKVRIESIGRVKPVEAYQLFDLEVVPHPPNVGDNYLFKHGLEYHWEIKFKDKEDKEIILKPVTREPRVTQFISLPDKKVKANVELQFEYKDQTKFIKAEDLQFESRPSRKFGFTSAFHRIEIIGTLLALLVAVGTGMSSSYFTSALEGSYQSYAALFMWGIGADQTKNLLQNLKSFMGDES